MTTVIGDATPGVERAVPPVPRPLWLVAHGELQTSRRLRVALDHLAAALGAL